MIGWFSSWLKDVISVILLAAIVDLLLPNKSMQRYARLVTGLIVLLVILSPLLKLAAGDINGKLDASIKGWDRELKAAELQIPPLDEILKKAEQASGQSREQAADLARTQLETEIKATVEKETGLEVSSVTAALSWDGNGGGSIGSVSVALAAPDEEGKPAPASSNAAAPVIAPVDITIDNSPIGTGAEGNSGDVAAMTSEIQGEHSSEAAEGQSPGKTEAAAPPSAAAIVSLISKGWQLAPRQIQVTQLAAE